MNRPPKWPLRILRWFCPLELLEEIEGDLYEQFSRDIDKYGYSASRRKFAWNAVRFIRPGIVRRNTVNSKFGFMVMFASNLRVATRVILRNKVVSAFSIVGLIMGLASALLMGLWLHNEYSFDSYHKDLDRIYQIYNQQDVEGSTVTWSHTPRILSPTLKETYSFVEYSASYASYGEEFIFNVNDKIVLSDQGIFTDPDYLKIFTFDFLAGSAETALNEPNSIILTRSFARLLFGTENILGNEVSIQSQGYTFDLEITGVVDDLPANTDFSFEYLIGFRFLENLFGKDENWNNNSVQTYLKLKPGTDAVEANDQLRELVKIHTKAENEPDLLLYPFKRTHLYGAFENGHEAGGRIEIIRILTILAISLVLIACINFINISTARAQKRSREIGIRKTIGAQKWSLTTQFLFESELMVFIAGIGALLVAAYALPWFNSLINQQLTIPLDSPLFWIIILSVLILTGLLAGIYPALFLSSMQPARSLKGKKASSTGRGFVRQGLVILQFGFAVMMIFSTVVIQKQIRHIQNRQAGYNKDGLIYHSLTPELNDHFETYKARLIQSGQVVSVTRTSAPVTEQFSSDLNMKWRGKDEGSAILVERLFAGDDFLSTIGGNLVDGREMDITHHSSDSNAVMINETAVRVMGFEDPVGEMIHDNGRDWKVVGVVKDFVLFNPQGEIPPVVIFNGSDSWFNGVHIRLNGEPEKALGVISAVFKELDPEYPFDYVFIEDSFNSKYAGVKRTLLISSIFGAMIIVIACAGLFALSIYLISNRMHEIGVRKVFGGTAAGIVRLLCWKSLSPIVIAICLFSPLAWISMDWWLSSYPYRISLKFEFVVMSALILIFISLATVIVQTSRAAATNPRDVLRME